MRTLFTLRNPVYPASVKNRVGYMVVNILCNFIGGAAIFLCAAFAIFSAVSMSQHIAVQQEVKVEQTQREIRQEERKDEQALREAGVPECKCPN